MRMLFAAATLFPEVWADQVRQVGTLLLQRFQEQSRVAEFVLVRRVLQHLQSFHVRCFFVCRAVTEIEPSERILVREEELVVERKLRIEGMTQHDVAEFMRQNHTPVKLHPEARPASPRLITMV